MRKEEKNSSGGIYTYLLWPLYLFVVLVIITGISAYYSAEMTFLLVVFTLFEFLIALYLLFTRKTKFQTAMMNFIDGQSKVMKDSLKNLNSPFCVCHTNGTILWANDAFLNLRKDIAVGQDISKYISKLNNELFADVLEGNNNIAIVAIDNKKYKVHTSVTKYNDIIKDNENKIFDEEDQFVMMLFDDMTEYYDLKDDYNNEKVVVGYIFIDNYEEATENHEDESKASMLISLADRRITKYISNNAGVVKKLEKDRYFFVMRKSALEEMMEDKFSILEQVKNIVSGNNIPLTLSIGIGYGGKSIESDSDLAGEAIDMALSRGGDQVVVKSTERIVFFGGKTASVDSSQNVRARVNADTLKEIIATKDRVLIMGHTNEDLDSFGASVAVYLMSLASGKETHIVHNVITDPVAEMKQKFLNSDMYPVDMFVTGEVAVSLASTGETLLVLVDHNTGAISDEKRLVEMGLPMVIIDHHRVQKSTITDTVMSYIEPGASSASEMTCNILNFFDDKIKLKPLEAESLLAGIMVDTSNFTYSTSAKTFDAASLLRKRGANINNVRRLLRVNRENEQIKNEIIAKTEFYKDCIAIAYIPNAHEVKEVSVLASQIANELINLKGVKASIVVYDKDERFSLSSRSIDEANVQVLMEKMGGGGHASQAGASVSAENIEQLVAKIKSAVNEMIEKGDIKV